MLKNISIGQYFPGDSAIHRIDPRMKLILTMAYVVALFLAKNIVALSASVLFLLIIYPISGIPFKLAWRSAKAILPIIMITAVINAFFVEGNILFQLGFVKITDQGLIMALLMTVRILCLIIGTSLLTYTTSPIALTDGIEVLFSPLKKFHLPVHEVAMMMTIALRFIPTLLEETEKIMSAQKARGADMESGNIMQRIRALIPILIPLFVSAFRRADDLALAMESRCYRGGEGRTRMRQLQYSGVDAVALLVVGLLCSATILANIYLPILAMV